jgi:hypothetical protein
MAMHERIIIKDNPTFFMKFKFTLIIGKMEKIRRG